MPPCKVIEYQSKDMDRFSIQCGVSTMPPDTVVACSGTRLLLPAAPKWTLNEGPPGGYCCVCVLISGLENNSPMPGARMSDDRVARSLMSWLIWLVAPSFQVS